MSFPGDPVLAEHINAGIFRRINVENGSPFCAVDFISGRCWRQHPFPDPSWQRLNILVSDESDTCFHQFDPFRMKGENQIDKSHQTDDCNEGVKLRIGQDNVGIVIPRWLQIYLTSNKYQWWHKYYQRSDTLCQKSSVLHFNHTALVPENTTTLVHKKTATQKWWKSPKEKGNILMATEVLNNNNKNIYISSTVFFLLSSDKIRQNKDLLFAEISDWEADWQEQRDEAD